MGDAIGGGGSVTTVWLVVLVDGDDFTVDTDVAVSFILFPIRATMVPVVILMAEFVIFVVSVVVIVTFTVTFMTISRRRSG